MRSRTAVREPIQSAVPASTSFRVKSSCSHDLIVFSDDAITLSLKTMSWVARKIGSAPILCQGVTCSTGKLPTLHKPLEDVFVDWLSRLDGRGSA